jgi:hypothetical protein
MVDANGTTVRTKLIELPLRRRQGEKIKALRRKYVAAFLSPVGQNELSSPYYYY